MRSPFGPLAGPECRRALDRPWVLVVRTLATLPGCMTLLGVVLAWSLISSIERHARPGGVILGGLFALEFMLVTLALVLALALLAGTLAGERARGVLALLLASEVTSFEILSARLLGKLTVVFVFLIAALPVLTLLGMLSAWSLPMLAASMLLPMSIAWGGGGMALAASAIAQRGRDALLAVYLLDLVLLLAPLFVGNLLPLEATAWLAPLNPYQGIAPLVEAHQFGPVLVSMLLWGLLGLASVGWAAWRLRPRYLRDADARPSRRSIKRRWKIPPVSDRPLLWKELYIEQAKRYRLLRYLGLLIAGIYLGSSICWALIYYWTTFVDVNRTWANWSAYELQTWIGYSSRPTRWLIEWSLGLRGRGDCLGTRTSYLGRSAGESLRRTRFRRRQGLW